MLPLQVTYCIAIGKGHWHSIYSIGSIIRLKRKKILTFDSTYMARTLLSQANIGGIYIQMVVIIYCKTENYLEENEYSIDSNSNQTLLIL